MIHEINKKTMKTIDLGIICNVVSNYFGCEPLEIFNRSRKEDVIIRRQWFQYLARTLNPSYVVSASQIGRYNYDVTGIKYDHATVLHNVKVVGGDIEMHKKLQRLEQNLVLRIRLASGVDEDPYGNKVSIPVGFFCTPMVFEWPVISDKNPRMEALSA